MNDQLAYLEGNVKAALESLPGLGSVEVSRWGPNPTNGYTWSVTFTSLDGASRCPDAPCLTASAQSANYVTLGGCDVELYVRLGFSEGAFPDQNLNEYVRLLPMLAGIESPGTLQEVIRGYVGDRDAKQIFDRSPFDVLGKGYQRPFELATLRLSNMIGILPNWGELVPNSELICQQGGTLVFQGSSLVHLQKDTGSLKYASIEGLLAVLEAS